MTDNPIQTSAVDVAKVVIGQFGSPYGVRGWIHVNSFTEIPERIIQYSWWINDQQQLRPVFVVEHQSRSQDLVVRLEDCHDRDVARKYTNHFILTARHLLPVLPNNEFYWTDLVGLQVKNLQGHELGVVKYLLETGANDVFVIQGEYRYLLPYIDAVVNLIDIRQGVIMVDWNVLDHS